MYTFNLNISPLEIWLALGVIFIVIEFTAIPGIGFLFLGFGSLTFSTLLYFYPELVNYQLAAVGLLSLIWFLILWKPINKLVYRKKAKDNNYFNLIGQGVTVVNEPLKPGILGKVSWSGTIMNAVLEEKEQDQVAVNTTLYVLSIKGNILICSQKPN